MVAMATTVLRACRHVGKMMGYDHPVKKLRGEAVGEVYAGGANTVCDLNVHEKTNRKPVRSKRDPSAKQGFGWGK